MDVFSLRYSPIGQYGSFARSFTTIRAELKKYRAEEGPMSVARYTGQEGGEEGEAIRRHPPEILLTNFMMLELLLTRQAELDQAVTRRASPGRQARPAAPGRDGRG